MSKRHWQVVKIGFSLTAMSATPACFPAEGFLTPILETTEMLVISPARLDIRLVTGWRHFGTNFFRYNFIHHDGVLCGVMPLRVRLEKFEFTKSQKRILRRNANLQTKIVPAKHCAAYDKLFERHKVRFTDNVPSSLRDFLSDQPSEIPCANMAVEVWMGRKLLAVSFMDLGTESVSSVYAMFDPEYATRSLGILTLLLEIDHARRLGRRFHYLGYAYTVPSVYDYKKAFSAVEVYDWNRCWMPLPENFVWSRTAEVNED